MNHKNMRVTLVLWIVAAGVTENTGKAKKSTTVSAVKSIVKRLLSQENLKEVLNN